METMRITTPLLLLSCLATLASSSGSVTGAQGATWREGESGTLECQLTGGISVNWTYPAEGNSGDRIRIENDGSVSRLNVNRVTEQDQGIYTCTGTTDSHSFSVQVLVNPRFAADQPMVINVAEGGDARLPCRVEKCRGSCRVVWRDTNIRGEVTRDRDTVTNTLTLTNVQQSDEGVYKCAFTSPFQERTIELNVLTRDERIPILNKTLEYNRKTIFYTEPLVLSCPVRSGENTTANPLQVTWLYTNTHGQQDHAIGQELSLPGARYERGVYKCTASNTVGSDSLDIFVDVQAPPLPENVQLPTVVIYREDSRATLKFSEITTPVDLDGLSYLWEKQVGNTWVPVLPDRHKYRLTIKGYLTIKDVSLADAGTYRVNISNEIGSSVQTQRVEVHTAGQTVDIEFYFGLPDMLTCSQLETINSLVTGQLTDYLQQLCTEESSLPPSACTNLQLKNITVSCQDREKRGVFTAQLSSSHAQAVVNRFEENGPTELPGTLNISPCRGDQCVSPTEVTKLEDIVIVLIVMVFLLVVAVVAIIIFLICVTVKKRCRCCSQRRCQVIDMERQTSSAQELQHHFTPPPPHLHTLHTYPSDPHVPQEPRYVSAPTTQ